MRIQQNLLIYTGIMYIFKNCRLHSHGFRNLMSSWGWGNTIFEITICKWLFKYFVPNASFFVSIIARCFENSSVFWKFQKHYLPSKIGSKSLLFKHTYIVWFYKSCWHHQLVKEQHPYIVPYGSSGSALDNEARKAELCGWWCVLGRIYLWYLLDLFFCFFSRLSY